MEDFKALLYYVTVIRDSLNMEFHVYYIQIHVIMRGQQCALIESIINFDSFIAKFFKGRIPGPPPSPAPGTR